MKLIIVDNHILFREGLAAILRPEKDIEIVGLAGSVQEAVDLARLAKPDIILMDYDLPDGTGADATLQILKAHPDCKVIFLTISDEDETVFAAVRSGAKGYLLKDIQPTKLMAAVRSVYHGESALPRSMTLRLMEELARTNEPVPQKNDLLETLSERELEVMREIARRKTNREIAQQLFIVESTVKYHVHLILEKLNLPNRRAVGQYVKDHNLDQ